jgi:hypothetical protein
MYILKMPYQIIKTDDGKFQLKNKETKIIVNKKFNSRAAAKKAGDNYHKYSTKKKVSSASKKY